MTRNLPESMRDYRTTPAAPEGEDTRLDALASVVCQLGGHIPFRDRAIPGACDFHRRMAAGYLRVIDDVEHQEVLEHEARMRVAGVRCLSCNLRHEEREEHPCVIEGTAHQYDLDELVEAGRIRDDR